MAIDYVELINAAEVVAQERNMRVTVSKSLQGAAVTGMSTFIGGILAGPFGLLLGAVLGGGSMAYATSGSFKSVVSVIQDMSGEQKKLLAHHLNTAIKDFGVEDLVVLSLALTQNGPLKMLIFNQVKSFLENEMQLTLA